MVKSKPKGDTASTKSKVSSATKKAQNIFLSTKRKAKRALSLKSKKKQKMNTPSEHDSSSDSSSQHSGSDDDIEILEGKPAAKKTSGKKANDENVTEDDCKELGKFLI